MLVLADCFPSSLSRSFSSGSRRALAAVSVAIALTSAAHAQWSVVPLHPPGALSSRALGTRNGQQVGEVRQSIVTPTDAALWTGSAASHVDLGPGSAVATDGQFQVGIAGGIGASMWSGTLASRIDLVMVGLPYPLTPTSVEGGVVVGYQSHQLNQYPVVWNTPNGEYVTTPSAVGQTPLYGISGNNAVGAYLLPSFGRALLWPNMDGNAVINLSPAGSTGSAALGIDGGTQVGWATFGTRHAAKWSGDAASFVDLAPASSTSSEASAVHGAFQVGFATFAGSEHAGLWTGTAGSWLDLHALLPATFASSRATGVWTDASGSTFVSGWAMDSSGFTGAFLWQKTSPGTPFCFGDGTGAACPCLNSGGAGRGCANGSEPLGGRLSASGSASIGNDQLTLNVVGVPNGPGLFFQGTTQILGGSGAPFGDGLRCAGGSIVRLGVVVSSGNVAQYPRPGIDPSVSARGSAAVGSLFAYQHYYRDTTSFCTTATFNLTNGVLIPWGP